MNAYAEQLLRDAQELLDAGDRRERSYLLAFLAYLQDDERVLPEGDFSEAVDRWIALRVNTAPNIIVTISQGDIGERYGRPNN